MKRGDRSVTNAASLSVAPMMDWTDRHCRAFHRTMSRRTLLYTEMVTAAALVRGGALHLLEFSPGEHPIALQLGGADPAELAQAAKLGADAGYAEVNLNVGCPSDRVQSGCFGAVLMERPQLVADCVSAMGAACPVPVTVKCRIGVDDQIPEEVLPAFIATLRDAGVRRVIVHARKAWLQGLSPRENREVPPLDHGLVLRMAAAFPDMDIWINGGIASLDAAQAMLDGGARGVMIGRTAYHAPADILLGADPLSHGEAAPVPDRAAAARAMLPYIDRHIAAGGRLSQVTRHMLGLFHGQPGARIWRRILSEGAHRPGAGRTLVQDALGAVGDHRAAA